MKQLLLAAAMLFLMTPARADNILSWKHLHRYLAEFEARWNMSKDSEDVRLDTLLESVVGLRLTYARLTA